MLTDEVKHEDCKKIACMLKEKFTYENPILVDLGEWSTLSGHLLLFVSDPSGITKFIALVTTETGFVSLIQANAISNFELQLENALYNGDWNVIFYTEGYEKPIPFQGHSNASMWREWNNTKYINKYNDVLMRGNRYTVNKDFVLEKIY